MKKNKNIIIATIIVLIIIAGVIFIITNKNNDNTNNSNSVYNQTSDSNPSGENILESMNLVSGEELDKNR